MSTIFECTICGEQDIDPTCPRCFSSLQFMIVELPEQYVLLSLSYEPPRLGGDGRSATAVHGRLPGREDILSLLGPASRQPVTDARDQTGPAPFTATLAGWVEVLTEQRHLTPCPPTVRALVERLLRHLRWIAEQPWAADFYREIQQLLTITRRITMTSGESGRMQLLPGVACPSCGRLGMVRYYPSDWRAECRFCPSVKLDERDYDALVRGQARDLDDTP